MREGRLFHRMKVELPVSLEIEGSNDVFFTTTMDVSVKGLAVKLNRSVEVGQKFKVAIGTDDNKVVKVDAEVVWMKGAKVEGEGEYVVGFRVIDKMDEDEIEFVRFVAKKMFEYFKTSSRE